MSRKIIWVALIAVSASLVTACVHVEIYSPGSIEVEDVDLRSDGREYPLPVLLGRFDSERFSGVRRPDSPTVVVDASKVGYALKNQVARVLGDASVFTRVLDEGDPIPASFVEISARVVEFRLDQDSAGDPRTSGVIEFSAATWPSAARVWTATIAVEATAERSPPPGSGIEPGVSNAIGRRGWHKSIDGFAGRGALLFAQKVMNSERLAAAIGRPAPVLAAEATRRAVIAVFDFEAKGSQFTPSELGTLTAYLSATLGHSRRFEVVPQPTLHAALRRQKKASYRDCYDASCQIEVGKELAAEKLLASAIVEFDGQCVVTLRLFDLKKATQELASTAKSNCRGEALLNAIERAATKLEQRP